MRILKPVEKECVLCGEKYVTSARNTLYCVDCRVDRHKASQKERYVKQKIQKSKKPSEGKTLSEVCAELKAYNEKHGTHLTYGQYVVMMDS